MKYLIPYIFCFTLCISHAQTESAQKSFQAELNLQYGNKDSSPLSNKEVKTFKGLPFYNWDKSLVVVASLKLTPEAPLFKMETTSNRTPLYQQYAIATFILNGQKQQLSIYQSQDSKFSFDYKDYLFLPFKDATNGTETYEGGRYVDVFISNIINNTIVIDFNKAYNPYCAYNHNYSCPIPPNENHLEIAIKAGVKKGLLSE
ncbi:DUF1684 domain-containing protein [Flavicella sp.]|uniref:DUF1684 domain-containing protein n=1 Tax=Flavicella sp. TaxID=2957742 RepID=UPI002627C0E8|nr:DUF1684 domain-containing protein [Flavicella sp.]MDG1804713.1 DUF1684 domain-containing protein [Flavicella sp.]